MYTDAIKESLNNDIEQFSEVFPIEPEMVTTRKGVSQLVMLDRYSFKDTEKKTLKVGDFVIFSVVDDPKFPSRALGYITGIDRKINQATITVNESFVGMAGGETVVRPLGIIDKPLELYYEQIAKRVAKGLSDVETDEQKRKEAFDSFYHEIVSDNFVPAGRVLYGAGAGTDVTYFNCYVMPYPKDSREGIAEHRGKIMEIMSRGGGVGTNGSTLRPRLALARGVNGRSSGAVSWINDIATLTHLVEQGGSRRGAQMAMMADWHPDIYEFIISKMQNPRILRFIAENTEDDEIKRLATAKLKFTPLGNDEKRIYEDFVYRNDEDDIGDTSYYQHAKALLADGGRYSVNDPEFLTGANISICLTKEFMQAVENDTDYELRFPDVENYDAEQMAVYNERWHEVGDVREWDLPVKTYRTINARDLWQLVNICATYSAEPGIFFIDNANDMTNAKAYGQKVVATNPCGEQPLAPYSVCNLAAINLANMANKDSKTVDFEKLKQTVRTGVRMQDNVIDATPYFLDENTRQAKGERRVGMGVMGLHDLLLYCEHTYGNPQANELVDQVFETIATTAYRESIELAKEKSSFPFLTDKTAFINTGFMRKMPEDIRQGVLKYGIRNSHLLTVAPTGSTGTMTGVSTGLEPYFSFKYYRSGRLGKFIEVNADIVNELGLNGDNLPPHFVSAMELSPEQHADTQCVIQRWVDSSLSKTVNAPKGYSVAQVQSIYERLWRGGAKGGTIYVDGSRDAQVLSLTTEENTFDSAEVVRPKVVLVNTVSDLTSTNVNVGNEIGDTCPVCRKGKVIDRGGCHTCDNCEAQLMCGL
jgi:ribonucleoside-diphosphate reductase alpha chain